LGLPQSVALVRAAGEVVGQVTSLYLRAIHAVFEQMLVEDARGVNPRDVDSDWAWRATCAELAVACGVSEYQVHTGLDAAEALATKLPGVAEALAEGRVDYAKVRAFVDTARHLDPEQARAVEDIVLPRAAELPTAKLRLALEEARVLATGQDAQERAAWAREERRVVFKQLSEDNVSTGIPLANVA
jgi:hypothetical protein